MTRSRKEKREDYFLPATIKLAATQVRNVPCKVYLPVTNSGTISLSFQPTKKQAQLLRDAHVFSVKAVLKDLSGSVTKIEAREVIGGIGSAYWGPRTEEHSLNAEPLDLTISHLNSGGNYLPTNRNEGTFWLTPCALLQPAAIVERSDTGNVKVKPIKSYSYILEGGLRLTFKEYYEYRENEEGEHVSFSELAGAFSFEGSRGKTLKLNQALSQLNDLLRIVSFISLGRCVCVGWDLVSGNKYFRHYRRNVVIPSATRQSRHEGIIEAGKFSRFLRTAYRKFTQHPSRQGLARAIDLAIPRSSSTVEGSFVTLFGALEALVLGFRRERDIEFNLPKSQWNPIQKNLKQYLASQTPFDGDAEARQRIYDKLPELNRIAFASAFERFCIFYKVDLSDLWPVVGSSGGPSLSAIRNKLVHGEVFRIQDRAALRTAGEHLEWAVDRMILAILGWPADKSHVSKIYLSKVFAAHSTWNTDRQDLSQSRHS